MADVDLVEELGGYEIPLDPMELTICESCE